LPKNWGTGQKREVLMGILALLTTVWVILNKPLSTTTNVFALPENWGTGQERDVLTAILALPTRVWVILNKP